MSNNLKAVEPYINRNDLPVFTITCVHQGACEESNVGRFPKSSESIEAETMKEAWAEFKSGGWKIITYGGTEGMACPSCVDYLGA